MGSGERASLSFSQNSLGCVHMRLWVFGELRRKGFTPLGGSSLESLHGGPRGLKKNKPEDPVFSSPFHSCATTSKSLHLSEPPFPHLTNEKNKLHLPVKHISYDLAIILSGIYPRGTFTHVTGSPGTRVLCKALLLTVKMENKFEAHRQGNRFKKTT